MKGKQGPGAGLNAFSCRGQHPHFAIAGAAAVVGRRRSSRRGALCQHPSFQGGRRQAPQHDLDGVVHEQRHAEQRQRLGVLEHDLQHGDAQGQRLVHGAEEHGHHVRAGETLFAVGVLFALVTALVAVTAQATAAAIAAATPAFAPASAAAAANLMRVGGQLEDGVHVDELEGHDECTRSQQHRSRDLVKHACFAANSFRRPLATTTTPPASAMCAPEAASADMPSLCKPSPDSAVAAPVVAPAPAPVAAPPLPPLAAAKSKLEACATASSLLLSACAAASKRPRRLTSPNAPPRSPTDFKSRPPALSGKGDCSGGAIPGSGGTCLA
eukprot:CAMPEP_0171651774 /NCGR_PEP_ID=MMETSP0990-20121206/38534_1 /TAXON_ID=483369 /ORGANISM="non described non described, Strain CCMP2098" /LENGTH=326 /DNA_ID=CAMNT_0012230817 /DNA_START=165 /DNA_END=1146 /DNA_ORIENTATION=+